MRVLLVEDEADLAHVVQRTLREEGDACDWAVEGVGALHQARSVPYDAIVLDLMLPGLDGWTLLSTLRDEGCQTPILIVTARDAVDDRVRGLDQGADDYLIKPFALAELLARLRALRRRSVAKPSPVLDLGAVTLDTSARLVRREEREVALTAKEYALLELLAFRRGGLVSRKEIYDHIYDDREETTSNVVDVYIANLRRKLGHDLILTRRGRGYMIP
jgi:two-component system OmpR family response regulator